ncbi:MAG TPA: diacylglycerol kinase family protein [Sphingomicrobium sp.]|nr:diacylglycerol kinase family protein [Sphingomicrobium sp.]
MTVPILINRGGGSTGDDAKARQQVAAALAKAGIDGKVELLDGEQLARRAKRLVAAGTKLMIVGGGDGTISAAAGAAADSKTTLGILPMGTLNHLARDLGISFDLDEAAAVIASGKLHRIDVAELNGRIFVNNCAIGLYPLMVVDRESQQKRLGRSKRLAMLVASARTLVRYHHHRLTLTINGNAKEVVETPLLFVGNNDYKIDMPAAGRRQTLDDGHLSVLVLRSKARAGMIAAVLRALVGRARPDDLEHIENVETLRVTGRRSHYNVAMDGETVKLAPPLDYRIRKRALRVMAPR